MQDEITIHIKDDVSVKVDIRENGIVSHKNIDSEALITCIKDSLINNTVVKSGFLPPHTLSVSTDQSNLSTYVVMDFNDDRVEVTYMNTTYERFPIPRFVFGFSVEQSGKIAQVNLGVPADEKLTSKTKMFRYPFSNVSRFDMCTGANPLPKIKSLTQLENLPYFILGLPDNDDHYNDNNNCMKMSHRDLMEHLRDKDRRYYYEHVLVPMPGTTLKDFI